MNPLRVHEAVLCLFIFIFLCAEGSAETGSAGIGMHSGFGEMTYKEHSTALESDVQSESSQTVLLVGLSGEYSFSQPMNIYVGLTTDWAIGLEGNETTIIDRVEAQTNDLRLFVQFYDFRIGYKGSGERSYYRLYLSGGWDGFDLSRETFFPQGVAAGESEEEISLWRTGAGAGFGYKMSNWAIDGRIAYAYYVSGSVKNSSFPRFTFNTNGSCFDTGAGIAIELTDKTRSYIGISYTLLELDESGVVGDELYRAVFPKSRMEILTGVINLNYAF